MSGDLFHSNDWERSLWFDWYKLYGSRMLDREKCLGNPVLHHVSKLLVQFVGGNHIDDIKSWL